MQRGIGAFFKKISSEKPQDATIHKKRRAPVIEDEDQESKATETSKKKMRIVKDDKSDDVMKKPQISKLKSAKSGQVVDPALVFKDEIQRINVTSNQEKGKSTEEKETKTGKQESGSQPSLAKVQKNIDLDSSPQANKGIKKGPHNSSKSDISDEERHERKKLVGILYQRYKNRATAINPGSKEVPKGSPDCLKGLSFLVTGVLESLERDEANSIIKEYGGKVMSTVGKKLNYLVVGEEAGPKKLAQAEELSVKVINEDEFFQLILERSGKRPIKNEITKDLDKSCESITEILDSKKDQKIAGDNIRITKKEKLVKIEGVTKVSKKERGVPNETVPKDVQNDQNNVKSGDLSIGNSTWVDKYKPKTTKDIIGQQGSSSNVAKLTNWLSKWYENRSVKKHIKPSPWAKNDDGSYFKAALLSGPPGIGKTTSAYLVSKQLGFDIVEFNASDTRSKRLLKEEVQELLSNKSLYGYFHEKDGIVSKRHVLIMDEVDGMAGNEDRGGIQELIGLIKETCIPIICMCNDRNHPKMRSLVNYCFDLRYSRPRLEQIKGRLMSICFKEDLKIPPAKLNEIIEASNHDIRQCINFISMWSTGKELQQKYSDNPNNTAQKDLKLGPWDVVRKVFSSEDHKRMSFNDKSDLFFHDYSLAPLFVQQNYLQVEPFGPKTEILKKVALTADALSLGDLVDKKIRSNSAWSLLPTQAVFSSVMPGEFMSGYIKGQINFPAWLGKNSRTTKRSRLAQEIHNHTRLRTSGSRSSIRLDYAPFLLSHITTPIIRNGTNGVQDTLNILNEYHLLREDIDSLVELSNWPNKKNPLDCIDGRVKAALTRAYNKAGQTYSFSNIHVGLKKKSSRPDDQFLADGDDDLDEEMSVSEEEDSKINSDAFIKVKKKTESSTTKRAPRKNM